MPMLSERDDAAFEPDARPPMLRRVGDRLRPGLAGLEAWARQLVYRPAVAAATAGAVVGVIDGAIGLLVAVAVGLVLLRRRTGSTPPLSGPGLVRSTLPLAGRALVGMFFMLPIASAGLVLPGFRNPDTIDRYLSILVAEPSNLTETQTAFPYPGIPVIVLASVLLVAFGLWRPRRRPHLLAMAAGFALFLASPTISAVINGDPGFHLDPGQYSYGLYVGLAGMALLFLGQRRPVAAPPAAAGGRSPSGGPPTGPPSAMLLLPVGLVGLPGGRSLVPLAFLGLPFEVLHHGLASLIAAGVAGAVGYQATSDAEEQHDGGGASLTLRHPAGGSQKVFTSGWVFGARCVLNPGTTDEVDVSDEVRWAGTGTFSPPVGATSRPTFAAEGANTIRLEYASGDVSVTKEFTVTAVSPAGFAHVGSLAACPADVHGCPACPHPTNGPITTGSPNVLVNGRAAARKGDQGVHAACCGPNTFRVAGGDGSVLINGLPAARIGSPTQHCGGVGEITG